MFNFLIKIAASANYYARAGKKEEERGRKRGMPSHEISPAVTRKGERGRNPTLRRLALWYGPKDAEQFAGPGKGTASYTGSNGFRAIFAWVNRLKLRDMPLQFIAKWLSSSS